MKYRALGLVAIALVILVSIGLTVTAGEGTWVGAKDRTIHLGSHGGMFTGEGATEIRMEDLADGETRVIGEGEKQITATRRGDVVAFSRDAVGDSAALDLECTIGTDGCRIVTFDDDPDRVMLIVEKVRRCENGEGDCLDMDETIHAIAGADGGHAVIHRVTGGPGEGVRMIRIKKAVDCDADGNCQDVEDAHGDGHGATAEVIVESLGAGAHAAGKHGEMVFIQRGDQVALRCSEGDTTMHVDPQEADLVFLCPKHSTRLEQVPGHPRVMRHRVQRDLRDSN